MGEKPKLILRRDALRAGVTDGELRQARRRGELVLVGRGGLVAAGEYDGASAGRKHLYSVVLAVEKSSPDAVVSHVSAALLHGIDVWGASLRRVHMTMNAQSGGRISRVRHVHAAPLAADEVVTVGGIVVTSIARTIVDLARTESFETAVVVGDSALHRKLVTHAELRAALESARPWPKAARAARAIAFMDGRSESVGESRSRVLIYRLGFPTPDLQRVIVDSDGREIGRVDFLFEDESTIGEFDGLGKYRREECGGNGESAEEVVIREKLREDELRSTGKAVARWTWPHLATPPGNRSAAEPAFGRTA